MRSTDSPLLLARSGISARLKREGYTATSVNVHLEGKAIRADLKRICDEARRFSHCAGVVASYSVPMLGCGNGSAPKVGSFRHGQASVPAFPNPTQTLMPRRVSKIRDLRKRRPVQRTDAEYRAVQSLRVDIDQSPDESAWFTDCG